MVWLKESKSGRYARLESNLYLARGLWLCALFWWSTERWYDWS
jgi:hypothetical protein